MSPASRRRAPRPRWRRPSQAAPPARAARRLDDPVAVAVGLDDRHHRGRARPAASVRTLCRIAARSTTISARAWSSIGSHAGSRTQDRGDRPGHVRRRSARPRGVRRGRAVQPRAHGAASYGSSPAPATRRSGRQDVAGPGGGQPGHAGGGDAARPSGARDDGVPALEQDHRVVLGPRPAGERSGAASISSRSGRASGPGSPACGVSTAGTAQGLSTSPARRRRRRSGRRRPAPRPASWPPVAAAGADGPGLDPASR